MRRTLSRRTFLKNSATLVAISAVGLATPCCREADKRFANLDIRNGRIHLDLNKTEYLPLTRPGGGVRIEFGRKEAPLLVIRVSDAEVAALSSECTHAGLQVLLPDSSGILVCSSGHGGRYDVTGKVLQPPPRKNLARYPATLEPGLVIIDYPA